MNHCSVPHRRCRLQESAAGAARGHTAVNRGEWLGSAFAGARNVTVRSAVSSWSPRGLAVRRTIFPEVLFMRMRLPSCRRSARGPLVALAVVVALVVVGWGGVASAQTPFVPYFGKNNIHYDKFDWHIYKTDHFEIYYYPDLERHLERVAGYAESAYQKISADLKHDLSFKVPLILFKTHSEFEQENVLPGEAQEGVGAFAESNRDRMLLPIDDPPDLLYGLITHELTHIFQFDIIPQSLIRRNYPLWVAEGGAEFERGMWPPMDLMTVRDAAVTDIVPKMSET